MQTMNSQTKISNENSLKSHFMKLQSLSPMRLIRYIKANKKELFWLWITYQSVKGILTLSLIWIPLWVAWKAGS